MLAASKTRITFECVNNDQGNGIVRNCVRTEPLLRDERKASIDKKMRIIALLCPKSQAQQVPLNRRTKLTNIGKLRFTA